MKWFIKCLRQYFDFKGRARRKEYWMFYLWILIIEAVIFLVSFLLGGGLPGVGADPGMPPELMPRSVGMGMFFTGLLTLYGLALFIPQLAVTVRRLHDTGKSGWWLLVYYIVIICAATVLSLTAVKATMDGNELVEWPVWVSLVLLLVISILFLVLMVKKGDAGRNKYGEDPKDAF